jgi:hypothetical protein
MSESNEFQEDDFIKETFESSSNLSAHGSLYIFSPDSLGSLSPTARAIMDELKDWHKRIKSHGNKEIHPSYLLTLDKVPEALNKFNSLSVQNKTEPAIHLALKQITDYDKKGQNRVAYIYPFLVRNGNKITSKIAIIAPQVESKTDAIPYRQACLRASQELIDMILSHRAKKIRIVDEDNPGAFLFAKTKTEESWLFPKLASFDSEITNLVRKGFPPVPPIPIPEFTEDVINYAKEQKSVIQILPDYHIIVDELELNDDGSFIRQPEIINQYRSQVDGLEKFMENHLRRLATEMKYESFIHKLDEFHAAHVVAAPQGRKQNSDKANEMIKIVESFPFEKANSNYGKMVKETIDISVRIIKKLLVEKDLILDRKDDSLYVKIRKQVLDRIPEFTKNNTTLMKLDFQEEIRKMGIKDETRIENLSNRLKNDVIEKFSYHEYKKEDGKSEFYIVDHGYMTSVLHKLTAHANDSPEYKRQLDIAKLINDKLSNPKHPELNSKLRPEIIVKLSSDMREMEKNHLDKIRNQEFQKKINLPAGLLAFIASILIFVTASYFIQSLVPIVFGVPFSVVIGIMAAFFYREKSREELRAEVNASGKFSGIGNDHLTSGGGIKDSSDFSSESSGNSPASTGRSGAGTASNRSSSSSKEAEDKKDAKILDILRAADGLVFPKKFNKITEKVLDIKTMRKKIYGSLKDIRRRNINLNKEKDDNKVTSTIEYSLVQSSAIISFPDEVAIKTMPDTLYILKHDLKSPLFREQLADAYREEMNKKKYDKKLVKYYTYLINTIEMEYFKYLPKKKL